MGSAAVLLSLQTMNSMTEDLMFEILQCLYRIQRLGTDAEFSLVPAHVGSKGNESADRKITKYEAYN